MIVAFSGLAGSGKDTAANVLITEYGFTRIAFADAVRDLALIIDPYVPLEDFLGPELIRLSEVIEARGWEWAKRNVSEVRRLLQVIGTEGGREFFNEHFWVSIIEEEYPGLAWDNTRYVITDCRFPNEVAFIRDKGGYLVWIERPGVESDGHASESRAISELATSIVMNDLSISEFEQSIRTVMRLRGIDPVER